VLQMVGIWIAPFRSAGLQSSRFWCRCMNRSSVKCRELGGFPLPRYFSSPKVKFKRKVRGTGDTKKIGSRFHLMTRVGALGVWWLGWRVGTIPRVLAGPP
jgi:hypothetical protein